MSRDFSHSIEGDDIRAPVPEPVGLAVVVFLARELYQHLKAVRLDDKANPVGVGIGSRLERLPVPSGEKGRCSIG